MIASPPPPSTNGALTSSRASQEAAPRRRAPPWPLVLLSAILFAGIAAWAISETWSVLQPAGPLTASGTVEADEVLLASEVAGRVVGLPVAEGQSLQGGAIIARVDDALIQTQLQQADAAMQQQLKVTADRYAVRAPSSAGPLTVTRVPTHAGEVVAAGQTIAAVADLTHLKATLYIAERDLGSVSVGQSVVVTADPFGNRSFPARVTSINSQAEFTPRNIQTHQDRLNLVFGVKLRVDNPKLQLKPGMPIDATFEQNG